MDDTGVLFVILLIIGILWTFEYQAHKAEEGICWWWRAGETMVLMAASAMLPFDVAIGCEIILGAFTIAAIYAAVTGQSIGRY